MQTPTEPPSSFGKWVIRLSSGDRVFPTPAEMLKAYQRGELTDRKFLYHPTARAWTIADFDSLSVCIRCGHIGSPKAQTKTNGCLAAALFLFFVIPGIIYLVWAETSKSKHCRNCDAVDTLVPLTSPNAIALLGGTASQQAPRKRCRSCGGLYDAGASRCGCGAAIHS